MPIAALTPGCTALFDCFDDGAGEVVGLVVVAEVVRIVLADRVLVRLVVARLMVVYEAAE